MSDCRGNLHVSNHPWDHGNATWWDYDWRKIAADYPERSAPRQVFTRIAEAIEAGLGDPKEGTDEKCCNLHGRNCEPPSELCCGRCTEFHHGMHADPPKFARTLSSHHDGSVCSNPDLSGFGPSRHAPADPEERHRMNVVFCLWRSVVHDEGDVLALLASVGEGTR